MNTQRNKQVQSGIFSLLPKTTLSSHDRSSVANEMGKYVAPCAKIRMCGHVCTSLRLGSHWLFRQYGVKSVVKIHIKVKSVSMESMNKDDQ